MYAKQKRDVQLMAKINQTLPDYSVVDVIGSDHSKYTFKVVHLKDSQNYILRMYTINLAWNLTNLRKLLEKVKSKNLLPLYEVTYDPQMTYLAVVEELSTVSLKTIMAKHVPEKEVWQMLLDVSNGLKAWHHRKTPHCRVKPRAIFKTSSSYMLGLPDLPYFLDRTISFSNQQYQRYKLVDRIKFRNLTRIANPLIGCLFDGCCSLRDRERHRTIQREGYRNTEEEDATRTYQLRSTEIQFRILLQSQHLMPRYALSLGARQTHARFNHVNYFVQLAQKSQDPLSVSLLLPSNSHSKYVRMLVKFISQSPLPSTKESVIETSHLQPYSCMTKTFFRPGRPRHNALKREPPVLVPLHESPNPLNEYLVKPLVMPLPEFLTSHDVFTHRFNKKPSQKQATFHTEQSKEHTQELCLTSRLSTLESTQLMSLPKLKRLPINKKEDKSKEVFLHQVIKKYLERQVNG